MRKLALSDEILMKVDKPARYIGNEFNSVMKDTSQVNIRFAMCFPDVYEIGMSHLGLQILYGMFNEMPDVWCERVFSPWVDLDAVLREEHIPLIESTILKMVNSYDDRFKELKNNFQQVKSDIESITDSSQKAKKSIESKGTIEKIVTKANKLINEATKNGKDVTEFTEFREEMIQYNQNLIAAALGTSSLGGFGANPFGGMSDDGDLL